MRSRWPWLLSLVFCLMISVCTAQAASGKTETFTFDKIYAQVSFDVSGYDAVLTPDNLSAYSSWLRSQNEDADSVAARFESEGVLLEAYDLKNDRVIVISAQQDAKSTMYFDINTQEDETRKTYRQSHTNGTYYSIVGYNYTQATWKNYGSKVGRFLRLKYTLMQNAQLVCSGYQRRTIRNGYTITLDVKGMGREVKSGDEKALENVMKGFSFTKILDAPEGQCKLSMTTEPAKEVNSSKITLAGKTVAGAEITVNLISATSSASASFTATAKKSGKFSVTAQFPEQGTYTVQLTVSAADGVASRTYTTMYRENYLPISLSTTVPTNLTADTLTISGETAKNVKVQISVTGPVSYNKSHTGNKFSFTFDTSKEGEYKILIVASKKGLDTRTLEYTATRTFGEAEKIQKIRDMAEECTYKTLTSKHDKYVGKTIKMDAYVIEIRSAASGDEWTLKMACTKTDSTYKQLFYVVCREEPALAVRDHITVYGTLSEDYYTELSGVTEVNYPRLEMLLYDDLD